MMKDPVLTLPAGDPHGHGRFPRGYDDPDPGMAAAPHGSTPGVDHEADQEPGDRAEISQLWSQSSGSDSGVSLGSLLEK